ncbi:hypothetical protein A3L04_08700 [Thermococcus chitonophagus]|uniref:Uncharacterized protein n=1 Tax=Thermococcus chitonophagus TaxID=54262 RepID=A0A160VSF1_9EURY|nr:S-layer protein [Thermococcus chitonophagus]ASJ17141.1 hypothetical protein A3L04_08700 [Thermococcus chitonophagus]CUX77750.1 hypothetical protein CHITON_0971 [Thermococcus chitonophagus]
MRRVGGKILVFFLLLSSVNFGNFVTGDQMWRYDIVVDPSDRILLVRALMSPVPDYLEIRHVPPGERVEIISAEGCTLIEVQRFSWKVTKQEDSCTIKYKVYYSLDDIKKAGYHKNAGITDTYAAIGLEHVLLYSPSNLDIQVLVTIHSPEKWKTYYTKPTIRGSMKEILRGNVITGEPLYEKSIVSMGKTYTYIVFKKPKKDYKDGFINQVPIRYYYPELERDTIAYLKSVSFYFQKLSQIFNFTPDIENILITPASRITPYLNGHGLDYSLREDHIAHHIVHLWTTVMGITTFSPDPRKSWTLDEGIANFYSFPLAYEYTKERRYLGHHYLYYLLYVRGCQERLKRWDPNDRYIEQTKSYLYGYIVTFYLYEKLKEVGKDFGKIYGETISKHKFETISFEEFLDIVESEGAKIDRDAIYNFDIDISKYAKQYYPYFNDTLKFFVLNHEAPPDLYYAMIDIEARFGNPEYTPYLYSDYFTSYFLTDNYRNFIAELRKRDSITKEEFLDLLTKFGGKRDFFEFYSKNAPIKPSIEAINLWLSGKYSEIVRKINYVIHISEKLEDYGVEVEEKEIAKKALDALLAGKFDEAENMINDAIRALNTRFSEDKDGDGVIDIAEKIHGTSPSSPDTDNDGIPDRLDVNIEADGVLDDWNTIYSSVPLQSCEILELRAYNDGTYIHIGIKLSKPVYEYVGYSLSFGFDDIPFIVFNRNSFWGNELTREMWTGNIYPNSFVFNNTIEAKLPLKVIKEWEEYSGGEFQRVWVILSPEKGQRCMTWLYIPQPLNMTNFKIVYGEGRVDKEFASFLQKEGYGTAVPDSENLSLIKSNLILVGGPVANKLTRKYLYIFPVEVSNTWPGKKRGVLMAKLYENRLVVIVAGSDRWGTKAATLLLSKLGYLPNMPVVVEMINNNTIRVLDPYNSAIANQNT